MDADDGLLRGALRRIYLFAGGLTAAGAAGGAIASDWTWGASFLAGGAASTMNFRWLDQLVQSLGHGGRPRRRIVIFLCLRYLLLSVGVYVIVKYFGARLTGLLAGLLVAGAAVMAEILYEIFHART
jgi:hypothetical protein